LKTVKEKAHKEALDDFRQKHFGELKKNLKVLKDIRDADVTADKDRIAAAKEIAFLLAARTQDKRAPVSKKPLSQVADTLNEEEAGALEELLNNA